MTKDDFVELLDRFANGSCTDAEIKILEEYFEKSQISNTAANLDPLVIEKAKLRLYGRIQTSINEKPKNSHWISYVAVAASVVFFIGIGLWVFRNDSNTPILKEGVTLTLADGEEIHLNSAHFKKILDEGGNEVAKQNGVELDFTDSKNLAESGINKLEVPYGEKVSVKLSDGTVIQLNSGSTLAFPQRFPEDKRKVTLVGEAFLAVAKDSVAPFFVELNGLEVRVYGTEFNVHAYPEDSIAEIVLVEGSVGLFSNVGPKHRGDSLMLVPGQMGEFDKDENLFSTKEVTTEIYTAWMKDELVFRDMEFQNILRKLERQYDVRIVNEDKRLSKKRFQASFGKKPPIDQVFEELSQVYGIQYRIVGDSIIIQ